MKEMKTGDLAFFYHTGDEKQVVGIAEVIREAYPDPTDPKEVFKAVDVKAVKPLPKPVTLAAVKAAPRLEGHVAGEICAPVGAAGDAGAMEDRVCRWAG